MKLKKMIQVMDKRNKRMIYGINKAAKLIINHAIKSNVGLIIIGYNDNFKDEKFSKDITSGPSQFL